MLSGLNLVQFRKDWRRVDFLHHCTAITDRTVSFPAVLPVRISISISPLQDGRTNLPRGVIGPPFNGLVEPEWKAHLWPE